MVLLCQSVIDISSRNSSGETTLVCTQTSVCGQRTDQGSPIGNGPTAGHCLYRGTLTHVVSGNRLDAIETHTNPFSGEVPMDSWYVHANGQQYGPVSEDGLRQWTAQGLVARDSLVSQAGWPSWVPAGTLNWLFPTQDMRSPVQPPPPPVATRRVMPPTSPIPPPAVSGSEYSPASDVFSSLVTRISTPAGLPPETYGCHNRQSAVLDNTARRVVGLIGCVVLVLGTFCPLIWIPLCGDLNYFANGRGDGVIVIVLAAISAVLCAVNFCRVLLFTGVGCLACVGVTFARMQGMFEQLAENTNRLPFLGGTAGVRLEWGWAVLVIGAILVIIAGAMPPKERR